MSRKFGIRDAGILLHRWTGLLIAAFLIIVGLTGSILAFEDKIDHWLNPELHVAHPLNRAALDVATFAERAEASDPRLRVNYFWVEEDQVHVVVNGRPDPSTGKPYELGYSELILDPYKGTILGKSVMEGQWKDPGPWRTRFLPFVYSLHTSMATGSATGWTFMGVIALLWTLDCFVAFYVTLPRNSGPFWQRWKQAWKVKWNATSTRVHFDLHRAGGLWLWPLLFIFGWSSVMFGLPKVYEPVMKHLFDYDSMSEQIARNAAAKPLDRPALSWRQAQEAGERAITEQASLHHFTVRRPYGMAYIADYGAYTYGVRSSIDFRGHGWDTSVLVDGNTGRLRSVDLARGQHLGNSIFNLLWGIHFADLRDWLPYRILVCLFGLFLSVISYTGVYIWWKKRKTRQLSRSHVRELAQEPARSPLMTTLMKSKSLFIVLSLVIHVSFALAQGQEANSQSPKPALRGKIVDPSGAVLTGASVTLKIRDGISLGTVHTDGQGTFSFTVSKPGEYSIEVSQTGFEKLVRNVDLQNGSAEFLTLILTIQKTTSNVTVSASQRDVDYAAPESSTADKINLPILLTPQSVQIVPRAVIQDQKILTLDDATRNVSGVTTDFGFNGSSEPLLILRGFTTVSMTAMGAMSGSSTYYLDGTKVQGVPANMANVQSVEVVKGPDSVMYGRSEPGGLVNVVRRPLDEQPSFALELTGSNYSTARGLAEVSGALNRSHTLVGRLAGSWLQNRSNRDFVRDKVGAITGDIAWRPTSGTRLALMVDYTDQEYRTDYGIPADVSTRRPYNLPWSRQFNSSPELSNVRPFSTFFEASQRLSSNWSVSGKAAIVTADSHEVDVAPYRVDLTTGEDCIVRANELCRYYFNDRPRGQYRLLQENVELRGDVKTGSIRHQIVIGGDFYNSRKIGTMYLQQLAPINIFNPDFSPLPKLDPSQSIPLEEQDKNRWTSGVFQDNLTLTRKLHAVVALRLDGTSAIYDAPGVKPNEDFFVTPRVGLVYEVANGHSIYAQYQDAVDTNNGRDPLTGKALAAERSREYEVGYKFSSPRGAWTATLAAYQLTKRNRADFTLFPIVSVVGKARSRGIELDVLGRVTPKLAAIISYGYTDAVVIDNGPYAGTFLANVPRHSGSTWLRYSIDKHWAAGAGVFAQSFRQGDIGNTFILPGYAREDAMLSYAFSTEKLRHEFQFNVNNLLDKRYYTGSHQFVQDWIRPGASRTFLLTYRVSR